MVAALYLVGNLYFQQYTPQGGGGGDSDPQQDMVEWAEGTTLKAVPCGYLQS